MNRVASNNVAVLRAQNVVVAPAGGVAVLQARVASDGYSQLVGTLRCNGGTPALGYPRVVEYQGAAVSRVYVLPQDTSQPNTSYPILVGPLSCPYVGIEYVEDGAGPGCTILDAVAELRGF